jgi:hypothetical protein
MSKQVYITDWQEMEGETIERIVEGWYIYFTFKSGKKAVLDPGGMEYGAYLAGDKLNREQLVEAGWMPKEEYEEYLNEQKDKKEAAAKEKRRKQYEKLQKEFEKEGS